MGWFGNAKRWFLTAVEHAEMVRRRPLLLFEITSRCNLDCRYCYNTWKNGADPEIELDTGATIKMLEKVVRESGSGHITYTGGEPLLREDLEEVIAWFTGRGVSATLISNGLLLDEPRARSLVRAGVGMFEIPLLAADKEIHDHLVRSDAFEQVLEAFANVCLAGGKAVAVFVATAENLSQWKETIRLSVALGAEGILFNRFNPGGEGVCNMEKLSLCDRTLLEEALQQAEEATREFSFPIGIPVPVPPCVIDQSRYPNLSFNGCLAGTENAYWTIGTSGNIRPCNHTPTVLGNIMETDFKEITNSEEIKKWSSMIPSSCKRCSFLDQCRGGCRAAAQVCSGSLDGEDPFVSAMGKYREN